MLVVDLLHEFELGVWKAVFIHLLWMLDSLKGHGLPELDQRTFRRANSSTALARDASQEQTGKEFTPQLASIEHHQTRICHICAQRDALMKSDPTPVVPDQHHVIGKSQNFPEDIMNFVQSNLDDLAVKDFVHKLRLHLLPHVRELHGTVDLNAPGDQPSPGLRKLGSVVFMGNRIY
ncbi:hypothetical protein PAXINDRAFT_17027 [Paxillus involutus ATCC 200175]|uniref:Uncharacterized protein n=1 Tax=Paxillus involutus ATCC 200175 TaxID=664439 RepID=A0A0C9T2J3_PAXIN|nr:hypothetical protein PAXINDRAFT_17027 [Paxillus involutus ATCC 200175]